MGASPYNFMPIDEHYKGMSGIAILQDLETPKGELSIDYQRWKQGIGEDPVLPRATAPDLELSSASLLEQTGMIVTGDMGAWRGDLQRRRCMGTNVLTHHFTVDQDQPMTILQRNPTLLVFTKELLDLWKTGLVEPPLFGYEKTNADLALYPRYCFQFSDDARKSVNRGDVGTRVRPGSHYLEIRAGLCVNTYVSDIDVHGYDMSPLADTGDVELMSSHPAFVVQRHQFAEKVVMSIALLAGSPPFQRIGLNTDWEWVLAMCNTPRKLVLLYNDMSLLAGQPAVQWLTDMGPLCVSEFYNSHRLLLNQDEEAIASPTFLRRAMFFAWTGTLRVRGIARKHPKELQIDARIRENVTLGGVSILELRKEDIRCAAACAQFTAKDGECTSVAFDRFLQGGEAAAPSMAYVIQEKAMAEMIMNVPVYADGERKLHNEFDGNRGNMVPGLAIVSTWRREAHDTEPFLGVNLVPERAGCHYWRHGKALELTERSFLEATVHGSANTHKAVSWTEWVGTLRENKRLDEARSKAACYQAPPESTKDEHPVAILTEEGANLVVRPSLGSANSLFNYITGPETWRLLSGTAEADAVRVWKDSDPSQGDVGGARTSATFAGSRLRKNMTADVWCGQSITWSRTLTVSHMACSSSYSMSQDMALRSLTSWCTRTDPSQRSSYSNLHYSRNMGSILIRS